MPHCQDNLALRKDDKIMQRKGKENVIFENAESNYEWEDS